MNVIVEAGLKQEEIIALLTQSTQPVIRFIGRSESNRMVMTFEVDENDGEKAVALVKSKLKAAPWGKMVYFIVHR